MTKQMTPLQLGISKVLCLLTMVLAILDQNIVSSAVVPIVRDLDPAHGVDHVSWLVAAFTLATTVMLPLYGRLCDIWGAKRVYLTAIGTFLLGSALCGAAQSMTELIAFRAVQGVGAGGLMGVTMVVMAQLKGPDDTKGPGGLAGLMAGFGMAIGPLVGGLLADHGSWRLIFYVNLPLGLVIIAGSLWAMRIPRHTGKGSLDLPGAALVAGFAGALLLICEWGGKDYGWTSPTIVALAVTTVACLALFLWRQATATQPIMPLSLFRIPAVRTSYVIQGLCGLAMMSAMVYLMVYLQVARGVSATSSGSYLAFMAGGLMVSGILGGRLGWSTRTFMLCGTSCITAALGLLATTQTGTSLWLIRGELVLLGLGFGQLLGKLIILVQQSVPRHKLGVATTGIRFFQALGGAMGAAALGSVLDHVFQAKAGAIAMTAIPSLPPAARHQAMADFVSSIDIVFAVAAAIMALAILLATRITTPEATTPEATTPEATATEPTVTNAPGRELTGSAAVAAEPISATKSRTAAAPEPETAVAAFAKTSTG